jgi:Undecaprenyl-phosphate galactose phosphotransferase WbaP
MRKSSRKEEFVERRRTSYSPQTVLIQPLPFKLRNARELMTFSLLLSDTISLWLAYSIAVWLRRSLLGNITMLQSWNVIPILAFFLLAYAVYGLYPGVGLSPVYEMKRLLNATSIVFLLLIALTFWEQTSTNYSRLALAAAWLMALVLVQADRWLTRIIGRKLGFWGEPVAVVGTGPEGQYIVQFLNDHIRLGMRPVLIIDGDASYEESALVSISRSYIRTVILVIPEISAELLEQIKGHRFGYHSRRGENGISRMIMISTLGWWGSLDVKPVDMEGVLGLQVSQNLINKWSNFIKRLTDLVFSVIFLILAAPFLLVIMTLIYLDSPGEIFYSQERLGRNGSIFKMWKFRTMCAGADQILAKYLAADPQLKNEFDSTQKLKKDPRITRMGKFLRKFSLDEIPQMINVLKGEMSLVGPRPYLLKQQEIIGKGIKNYQRVRPGMTGMWQVQGRGMVSFIGKERDKLDEYYVSNWSIWLDIYLLLRTVQVVLSKDGAY